MLISDSQIVLIKLVFTKNKKILVKLNQIRVNVATRYALSKNAKLNYKAFFGMLKT